MIIWNISLSGFALHWQSSRGATFSSLSWHEHEMFSRSLSEIIGAWNQWLENDEQLTCCIAISFLLNGKNCWKTSPYLECSWNPKFGLKLTKVKQSEIFSKKSCWLPSLHFGIIIISNHPKSSMIVLLMCPLHGSRCGWRGRSWSNRQFLRVDICAWHLLTWETGARIPTMQSITDTAPCPMAWPPRQLGDTPCSCLLPPSRLPSIYWPAATSASFIAGPCFYMTLPVNLPARSIA